MFGGGSAAPDQRITDDQLVAALAERGQLYCAEDAGSQLVVLSTCGSINVARRLQAECGVPVVVAWEDEQVPAKQCVVMVRGIAPFPPY